MFSISDDAYNKFIEYVAFHLDYLESQWSYVFPHFKVENEPHDFLLRRTRHFISYASQTMNDYIKEYQIARRLKTYKTSVLEGKNIKRLSELSNMTRSLMGENAPEPIKQRVSNAEKLRLMVKITGLTEKSIAIQLGMSPSSLSNWKRGLKITGHKAKVLDEYYESFIA